MCLCKRANERLAVCSHIHTYFSSSFSSFVIEIIYSALLPILKYDHRQIVADRHNDTHAYVTRPFCAFA